MENHNRTGVPKSKKNNRLPLPGSVEVFHVVEGISTKEHGLKAEVRIIEVGVQHFPIQPARLSLNTCDLTVLETIVNLGPALAQVVLGIGGQRLVVGVSSAGTWGDGLAS
jgi:hypothetical protein